MEEAFLRFPHLSERIFDSVTDKSLTNCKRVSKSWNVYLDAQKFLKTRIIKSMLIKSMTFIRFTCPMCLDDFVGEKSVETHTMFNHITLRHYVTIERCEMWVEKGILVEEMFYKCPMWDGVTSTMCNIPFNEETEWKEVKQHITSRHVESDGDIFEDFLKI